MEETMNKNVDIRAINEKIEKESAFVDLLTLEMNKVIIGQKHMVERLLIGLLGSQSTVCSFRSDAREAGYDWRYNF